MVVVVAIVMALYACCCERTVEVAAMSRRAAVAGASSAGRAAARRSASFFLLPLLALLDFSTTDTAHRASAPARPGGTLVAGPDADRRRSSPRCCWPLLTVVGMLVLLVPTMIWVRLRVPQATRLVEFLCLLPLTIPALVIVVGIDERLRLGRLPGRRLRPHARPSSTSCWCCRTPTARSTPRCPRSTRRPSPRRPARSGPSWFTVIARVIAARTSGPASLAPRSSRSRWCSASSPSPRCSHYNTLPVVIVLHRQESTRPTSMAASLASLLFAALLLLMLSFLDRRRRDPGRKPDDDRPPPRADQPRARRRADAACAAPTATCTPSTASTCDLAARRAGGAARPVGLRQDHRAADPGRPRAPGRGHGRWSAARTSPGCPPTSATWGWSSRPTACSRT